LIDGVENIKWGYKDRGKGKSIALCAPLIVGMEMSTWKAGGTRREGVTIARLIRRETLQGSKFVVFIMGGKIVGGRKEDHQLQLNVQHPENFLTGGGTSTPLERGRN